jgi:RNA polymerase sigma-70 factor (ECF subfamily)
LSLSDGPLVKRLCKRDEEAFREMVRRYGDQVFNLVLRMVTNRAEAEDIAQEVFITVFKKIDTFRGESKFSTWLLQIAANHAKNRIKALARHPTTGADVEQVIEAGVHGSAQPAEWLEAAETEVLMQRAIANLEEDHRLLVVLRDIQEMSYDEICEITGLPEGTVKSRLHRARMALKETLRGKI